MEGEIDTIEGPPAKKEKVTSSIFGLIQGLAKDQEVAAKH